HVDGSLHYRSVDREQDVVVDRGLDGFRPMSNLFPESLLEPLLRLPIRVDQVAVGVVRLVEGVSDRIGRAFALVSIDDPGPGGAAIEKGQPLRVVRPTYRPQES